MKTFKGGGPAKSTNISAGEFLMCIEGTRINIMATLLNDVSRVDNSKLKELDSKTTILVHGMFYRHMSGSKAGNT